jgi:chromosome segregation ATPase
MNNFQQNLLIILALGLCGLCAFQWHIQTAQRNEITTQNGILYEKNVAIQSATNSIATLNAQVAQMDASLTETKAVAATNQQLATEEKAEIIKLHFANENLTNEIAQYKAAVETLQSNLKEAYASMEQQNEAITNLVSQRDDFVKKYNNSVQARNDVVAKYNDLVKQIQSQSGGGRSPGQGQTRPHRPEGGTQ